MKYVILSGRYETGNEEQQQGYKALFGEEDINRFFDLYFHWYNVIHEMGHCLVEKQGAVMSRVEEEMYVNSFAVAYYRFTGDNARLRSLQERLTMILARFPAPMPDGESFTEFYERIWNTEQINNVMIYGYFQLNSVLEALKGEKTLKDVLDKIGITIDESKKPGTCDAAIVSENAPIFLQKAVDDLKALGIDVPEIRVELVDDPMVQCARND